MVDLTISYEIYVSHESKEDPRKAQDKKQEGGEEEREDLFTLIL